jgi:hypothetical protein
MYSNHNELTIGFLLKLPFTKIRKWEPELPEENSGKEEIWY